MSDSPVRIGFVGVGGMGQSAHLRNYAELPECTVCAIAEPLSELGKKVAARYDVPKVYTDVDEMIKNEELDGIVASQQFTRHGEVILPLYRHGLPIFTEKPLAGSIEIGKKMLAALKDGGSWHMVGYHKRSEPAVVWAAAETKRLKETGELGPLKYIRILMPSGDWVAGGFRGGISVKIPSDMPPLTFDPGPEGMSDETAGRYVNFVNFYIHQVNLFRAFLDEPYAVSYADPSGILLTAHTDSGIPMVLEMTPYSTTRDWQESVLVAFAKGWIKIDIPAPLARNRSGSVEAFYDPGDGAEPRLITPRLPFVHAMYQQAAAFVSAIKGETPPPCEAAEALEDLIIALQYIDMREEQR